MKRKSRPVISQFFFMFSTNLAVFRFTLFCIFSSLFLFAVSRICVTILLGRNSWSTAFMYEVARLFPVQQYELTFSNWLTFKAIVIIPNYILLIHSYLFYSYHFIKFNFYAFYFFASLRLHLFSFSLPSTSYLSLFLLSMAPVLSFFSVAKENMVIDYVTHSWISIQLNRCDSYALTISRDNDLNSQLKWLIYEKNIYIGNRNTSMIIGGACAVPTSMCERANVFFILLVYRKQIK